MKRMLLLMCILLAISTAGMSQQWQSMISLDSRIGYSTNSYLNPFLSEWAPSIEAGYNFSSILGQTFWYKNGHSLSLTGGGLYMPYFTAGTENWKGGLGLVGYNYRLFDRLSIGIEGGASYLTSNYSRTLLWAQPNLTWFVSPYTLFRTKAGPNFRSYRNYAETGRIDDRIDHFSFEFETWTRYRWRLTAGVHGRLATLPDIGKGFNTQTSVGYYFKSGSSLTLSGSLDQYQYEETVTEDQRETSPPGNEAGNNATSPVTNTDRIISLAIEGSLPINKRFTLFAGLKGLQLNSESSSAISSSEFKVSGGVRFNFEPRFRARGHVIQPEWKEDREEQEVRIRYSGGGRLYLVGSFNNWNKNQIPLTNQAKNIYTTKLALESGAYEYKVLKVQGDSEEWLPFSEDVYTVDDGFGSENGMLLVE